MMLWTALRQPFSLFELKELEESHGTSGYDWIGYRKVGLSGSRGCRDGQLSSSGSA